MIDRGSGVPVVLIPGLQGRREWMQPAVDALAARCRVLTFSLCDEPTSGFRCDPEPGFAAYVNQIEEALRRARVEKAIIIGVSYGGLIATEFALRRPDRVLGLVLSSAPPPGWPLDRRHKFYSRAPLMLSPLFVLGSLRVMLPELRAALDFRARVQFILDKCVVGVCAPCSPSRMARRGSWIQTHDFGDPRSVCTPALVITGEDGLDRVVPPSLTRQYLDVLRNARYEMFAGTGHLGLITKPAQFAELVRRFADEISTGANRIPA